jgi:hypothetical protein
MRRAEAKTPDAQPERRPGGASSTPVIAATTDPTAIQTHVKISLFLIVRYLNCAQRRGTPDHRRERAWAANPPSKKPEACDLNCGAAARVHPIVRQCQIETR